MHHRTAPNTSAPTADVAQRLAGLDPRAAAMIRGAAGGDPARLERLLNAAEPKPESEFRRALLSQLGERATLGQCARAIGRSINTLGRWRKKRHIKASRPSGGHVYVDVRSLADFIEGGCNEASE